MTLHIAFNTDNNYVQHMGISMLSLFCNNQQFENIIVHILGNGISEINKLKLQSIAKEYSREIKFHDLNFHLKKLDQYNIPKAFAITAYARLFLASILDDNIEKVIYADCDSIFNGNLYELWAMDISNYSITAVEDYVGAECKINIDISESSKYINAGFMLMNLKKIRLEGAEQKMLGVILKYNGNVFHYDQGIINAVFEGDICFLHPKYNVMTGLFDFKSVKEIERFYNASEYYNQSIITEAKEKPIFIHFTPSFSKRPWIEGCRHPLKNKYFEFYIQSPWSDIPINKDLRPFKIKLADWIFVFFGPKIFNKLFS